MIKKILQPSLQKNVDPTIHRAVRDIYDNINSVIESVNNTGDELSKEHTGKNGDIRTVEDKSSNDNKYRLQIRTAQGWSDLVFPDFGELPDDTGSTAGDLEALRGYIQELIDKISNKIIYTSIKSK